MMGVISVNYVLVSQLKCTRFADVKCQFFETGKTDGVSDFIL